MIEELTSVDSANDVLRLLNDSPSHGQLKQCLDFLAQASEFDIRIPGPLQVQIITVLVEKTVPDFCTPPIDDQALYHAILKSLTSISGLGAIVARLRTLSRERAGKDRQDDDSHALLNALSDILRSENHIARIWSHLCTSKQISPAQGALLWKEYISLTAGSRITGAAAEFKSDVPSSGAWLADGASFAEWLGEGVGTLAMGSGEKESVQPAAQFTSKALSFGYLDSFLRRLIERLCISKAPAASGTFSKLISTLHNHDQRKVLGGFLTLSSFDYLREEPLGLETATKALGAVIALLTDFMKAGEQTVQRLIEWLTDPQRLATASTATLRATVAAMALHGDKLEEGLFKIWEQWSNELFIRHAPSVQQKALSQALLLIAGYVNRTSPTYVFTMARSTVHTRGLSNRLASTSPQTRWLGMIVGMAISACVDRSETKLTFDDDSLRTEEAKWYYKLTRVEDRAGNIRDLPSSTENRAQTIATRVQSKNKAMQPKQNGAAKANRSTDHATKASSLEPASALFPSSLRIVEFDETEGLVPHAKPDSDPEDNSTDPTMINRHKAKPPVYIRDLITYLLDGENIERRTLALQTAPSLIRRKSRHGKEVTDHLDELATVIAGLNDGDTFDVDDEALVTLRRKGLQAVLVADPKRMGPWFAKAIFNITADYSMAQRMGLLIAVGMGGRELAGHNDGEEEEDKAMAADMFPSKRLKGKMHDVWAIDKKQQAKKLKPMGRVGLLTSPSDLSMASPMDRLATDVERTMLEPLALEAADKLSGPDVLKVRKFSSRMDVERKKVKPKANELSKILAEAFFLPLTGYLNTGIQVRSGASSASFNKYLLPTYLRTLSLLLHSAGPYCPNLAALTTEFWNLLLSLRSTAMNDNPALEALLFSLLTILELNLDKQEGLVRDNAKELIETQEWARMILDDAPSGPGEKEENIKMLAAGIVVRCSEIVQGYQRHLLGDMMDT